MRTEVHSEPEYDTSFHVEELEDGSKMTFFHCDVFYFSHGVLRKMKAQWDVFREHVPQALFCHGEVDDNKFEKFIRHFGFTYLTDVLCTDGVTRRLFINLGGLNGRRKQDRPAD